ncbi:MAG: HlyD family secretion protein [Alphaproteobacteria bacterium]
MDDTAKTSTLAPARAKAGRLWLAFLVVALILVGAGFLYLWRQARLYPSTDDAYLGAHIVDVGALVGGRVEAVFVAENEAVKAGTPLFRLDQRPFDYRIAAAQANLDQALQSVGAGSAAIAGGQAAVRERAAALANTRIDAERVRELHTSGDASQARLDTAEVALTRAKAALAAAQADLERLEKDLGQQNEDNARVRAALAALDAARFDKEQSSVTASADGYITGLTVRPGAIVRANETLFHLVETSHWWVDANFKETQMARVRPCKKAEVKIDMYPGLRLTGKVEGVSAGSGAAFSLFPPENATGNWVKVTQRFPVRIALDPEAMQGRVLRVGSSAWARIDTTSCP